MHDREAVPPALQGFVEEEMIDRVLLQLKSGKEATVYVVEKTTPTESLLYAAKVYRDLEHTAFRRDEVYREGRVILDARLARAVAKKTRLGRQASFGMWVGAEAEMLRQAYGAGADVPELFGRSGSALLLEYFGDRKGPAPMLSEVRLSPEEAQAAYEDVMANVETLLRASIVHGDLSPFNVLFWEGRVVVIDLPQAVDARLNRHARDLLARDIRNVCAYFQRQGVETDPEGESGRLWGLWEQGRL